MKHYKQLLCPILLFSFGLAVEGTWGGGKCSGVRNNEKHYVRMYKTITTYTNLGHHGIRTDTSQTPEPTGEWYSAHTH